DRVSATKKFVHRIYWLQEKPPAPKVGPGPSQGLQAGSYAAEGILPISGSAKTWFCGSSTTPQSRVISSIATPNPRASMVACAQVIGFRAAQAMTAFTQGELNSWFRGRPFVLERKAINCSGVVAANAEL